MLALLQRSGSALYEALVGQWVWALFREGPAWAGGWAGLHEADMCARMAPATEVADWVLDARAQASGGAAVNARCLTMVDRAFKSYACVVHVALYVLLLLWAWRAAGSVCALLCRKLGKLRLCRRKHKHGFPAAVQKHRDCVTKAAKNTTLVISLHNENTRGADTESDSEADEIDDAESEADEADEAEAEAAYKIDRDCSKGTGGSRRPHQREARQGRLVHRHVLTVAEA